MHLRINTSAVRVRSSLHTLKASRRFEHGQKLTLLPGPTRSHHKNKDSNDSNMNNGLNKNHSNDNMNSNNKDNMNNDNINKKKAKKSDHNNSNSRNTSLIQVYNAI